MSDAELMAQRLVFRAAFGSVLALSCDLIVEHAAEHALPWAVAALGPVPGDPLDRLDWQRRASVIGAYRQLYGYHHPAEPIGPEPAVDTPDKRAAWHEAFAALRPAGVPEVRGLPDGTLLHLRDTYPIETGWAPPWTGTNPLTIPSGPQPTGSQPRRRRPSGWTPSLTSQSTPARSATGSATARCTGRPRLAARRRGSGRAATR